MGDLETRAAVLFAHGATLSTAQELLAYGGGPRPPAPAAARSLPLADEPHIAAWAEYEAEAAADGAWPALRRRLVQLRFPVRAGMSQEPAYQAATRRGEAPDGPDAGGPALAEPGRVGLALHHSPAGAIPVVSAGCRADFALLVQALLHKNEPTPVPAALGGMLVSGYTNWDRVRRLRERWAAEGPADDTEAGWAEELRLRIRPFRPLYQDSFILVGDAPYSGVPAGELGLGEAEWRERSLRIRVAHEATHYLTQRLLGAARGDARDELIADYAGIVAACGRYRADWALRFLGLEQPGAYRPGGRLEHYRGEPALSEPAFALLQRLVVSAVAGLERFDREQAGRFEGPAAQAELHAGLARLSLEELAADEAPALIERALRRAPGPVLTI